jgi:hypothetical protein
MEDAMDVRLLDALRIRASGAVTRRQAFPALGAAVSATRTNGTGLAAKGNDKQKANKARRKFKQRCKQQQAQCRARFAAEPTFPCCESCFSDDFVTCFLLDLAE